MLPRAAVARRKRQIQVVHLIVVKVQSDQKQETLLALLSMVKAIIAQFLE
jgi:hypothetical protein